jgi:hypothetical protein
MEVISPLRASTELRRGGGGQKSRSGQVVEKEIATVTMGGIRKNVRPRKRWRDKVEEGLNIMGIRKRQVVVRDRR